MLQIIYLQSIAKVAVAYVMLGTLIRLMQAAGMHRAQDVSTPEGIVKTNVMNVVYVMEK
jgi:type III secretory pathway component EscS